MRAFTTGLAAARRRSGSGLFYLVGIRTLVGYRRADRQPAQPGRRPVRHRRRRLPPHWPAAC